MMTRLVYIIVLAVYLCACNSDNLEDKGDNTKPNLVLVSPLPTGTISGAVDIKWQAFDDNPAFIDIDISQNNQAYNNIYHEIFQPGDGSFSFDSTAYPNGAYKIRLKATDIPNNTTILESSFSIDNSVSVPLFDLNIGLGTEPTSHFTGGIHTIRWEGTGLSGALLDIDYSVDDTNYPPENNIVKDLALSENMGSYQWDTSSLNLPQVVIRLTARKASDTRTAKTGYFAIDNTSPTLPTAAGLYFDEIATDPSGGKHILLAWNPALDNSLAWTTTQGQPGLVYKVYSSDIDNITSYSEILANNPTEQLFSPYPYRQSFPEVQYFDLGTDTTLYNKYWNVVAFDQSTNAIAYTPVHGIGSFVSNFATNGQLMLSDSAGANLSAEEIITDNNNNIVVAGHNNGVLTVWKFDATATNNTFGSTGKQFPNPHDNADTPITRSIALDYAVTSATSQYRIYLCGQWVGPSANNEMMILAFDENGEPDLGFNGVGYASYPMGVYASCNDIVTDGLGSVYVAGEGQASATSTVDALLLKYDRNGKLDSTFSGDGQIILDALDTVSGTDIAHGVTIDKNNNVLVTGTTDALDSNLRTLMFVARYDISGNAVNFSSTGKEIFLSIFRQGNGDEIAVDPNGNILVLGASYNDYDTATTRYFSVGLWRYDANGNPNSSNPATAEGFLTLYPGNFSDAYPNNNLDLEYFSMAMDDAGNIAVATNSFFTLTQVDPYIWYIDANGFIPSNWTFNIAYSGFFNDVSAVSKAIHINPQTGMIYSAGYRGSPAQLHIMAIR